VEKHTSFNVLFVSRTSKNKKLQKENLFARITVEKQRVEFSLGREVSEGLFSTKAQRCFGNSKEAKEVNEFLVIVVSNLNEIRKQLILEDKVITAELIRCRYKGESDPDEVRFPLVLELYDEHNSKFAELIGTNKHSKETLKRHKVSRKHVYDFIKKVYKAEDLSFDKIDYRFLCDFEHYLKSVRKCNQNSTMKYIKNMGKIVNQAHAEGYMAINPFSKFKLSFEKVKRDPLTDKEVKAIMELELDERLEKIRDLFLFCIYTGLAFVDLENLTINDLHEDKEGNLWIAKNRNKTDVEFLIPVLSIPKALIEKYAAHPLRCTKKMVMPIVSNQKYNAYLKEIATLAKIKKKLTTHLARHTFATTITLANGVPIEVVSKMLGHSSIRTTQIYAQVQERLIINSMDRLMKEDFNMDNVKMENNGFSESFK
jgi:site-specific recombinase XerD